MSPEVVRTSPDSLPVALARPAQAASHRLAPDRWPVDPALGQGYVQLTDLGPHLKLLVHQYVLHQPAQVRKAAAPTGRDVLIFSFRHVYQPPATPPGSSPPAPAHPTVRVSSADLAFEQTAPAHTVVNAVIVAANVALFQHLPAVPPASEALRAVLTPGQSCVYEVPASPAMRTVAAALVEADVPPELRLYYLRVKAEELLYLFLAELLKRPQAATYPLNVADVGRIYALRDQLLADLSAVPKLAALAQAAGLSESKLKRLFRQIFGTSLYAYYQAARLDEAARLLREQRLSVAQVAHQLGFTNLSHFTRLFARHTGRKPKQFSKDLPSRPVSGPPGSRGVSAGATLPGGPPAL